MMAVTNLANELCGKTLLIFDFDGTVADSSPLHAAAFRHVLAPLDIAVDYPSIAGLKTLDAMRRCFLEAGRSLDEAQLVELTNAKQRFVRQLLQTELSPLPGVDEFLRWARPRFGLAMVTSGSRGSVVLALETLGYTNWFDPLICAEDVLRGKPDPEGLLRVLNLTGVAAENALMFEDSHAGFEAAKAAHVPCVDAEHYFNDVALCFPLHELGELVVRNN